MYFFSEYVLLYRKKIFFFQIKLFFFQIKKISRLPILRHETKWTATVPVTSMHCSIPCAPKYGPLNLNKSYFWLR